MIVAIGIDLVEIIRIEQAFDRRGDRFRSRVFTYAETNECEQRASRLASYAVRFAAKEAAMKALGTGWAEGIAWKDIEVLSGPAGAPKIQLHNRARDRMRELGATRVHVSLSHSGTLAIAQVVLES